MPVQIQNLEWLNENSQRAYPLTEAATKVDTTGGFTLSDDFILDLAFPVHTGLDVLPGRFFLRRVEITALGFSVSIAYDDGTASPPIVASIPVTLATHTEYLEYSLPGRSDFSDGTGQIVFGKPSAISAMAPGVYTFAPAAGQLEVHSIHPNISGVSAFVLINGANRSARLQGDLEIEAGNNIRLTTVVVEGQPTKIRVDAIDGEGLSDDCICDGDDGPCIRTLSGVPPTADGEFTLLGDECITISTITNGLKLEDVCSKPCCDCVELEALTAEMEIFGSAATTVRGFVNRLQSEVTQMSQVVLGSVLQDDGCISCDVA